jgi:hypothetical protein
MTVNARIPNNFKEYAENNSDFPKKLLDLLNEFLKTSDRSDLDQDQMNALYDQFLDKYVSDDEILEWSKKNDE